MVESPEHQPMTFRAILSDHDGTLVDSEPVHHRIWNEVLAPCRVVIPEERYRRQ
jgi:beta-phosphoglucomutase-like phosphatase (HAD superfamily)